VKVTAVIWSSNQHEATEHAYPAKVDKGYTADRATRAICGQARSLSNPPHGRGAQFRCASCLHVLKGVPTL
jgi:hypothetical protein